MVHCEAVLMLATTIKIHTLVAENCYCNYFTLKTSVCLLTLRFFNFVILFYFKDIYWFILSFFDTLYVALFLFTFVLYMVLFCQIYVTGTSIQCKIYSQVLNVLFYLFLNNHLEIFFSQQPFEINSQPPWWSPNIYQCSWVHCSVPSGYWGRWCNTRVPHCHHQGFCRSLTPGLLEDGSQVSCCSA